MNLKIVSLPTFDKHVKKLYKKYRLIGKDLKDLQSLLLQNPSSGIELGNGCYKVRIPNASIPTGKSGGFRVVYYYVDKQDVVYLMVIYTKTEVESIRDEVLLAILKQYGLS